MFIMPLRKKATIAKTVEEQSVYESCYLSLLLKGLLHRSYTLKKMPKLFKIIISNPFQSLPPPAILVSFCSRINPLLFFFLSKPLFLGFATF